MQPSVEEWPTRGRAGQRACPTASWGHDRLWLPAISAPRGPCPCPRTPHYEQPSTSQPTLPFLAKVWHLSADQSRHSSASGASAMTFDDILEQVINLLKRQGRVSYRALKRRFNLDDQYLEDLKDEIIEAHPVHDENGSGLVWTGTTASVKEVVAPPAQPTQPPAAQQQPSPAGHTSSTVPPAPDAERRQLTVMFCDLVDSTKLSCSSTPKTTGTSSVRINCPARR